jgi:flagellar basal body-associated protein FliL
MIIIAVVALLLLGGGGFFAMKYLAAQSAAKAAAAGGAAAAGPAAPAAPPAADASDDDADEPPEASGGEGAPAQTVLMIGPLIVNLDRKNAFLKCSLSILFRNPELAKLATSDKPTAENAMTRAVVLEALSGKTVEEASDVETRESIRQEIKDKLNERFKSWTHTKEALDAAKKSGKPPKAPVKDVLVVDWALQQ